jgi:hypothetical protein
MARHRGNNLLAFFYFMGYHAINTNKIDANACGAI